MQKILIIEDEELIRENLKDILELKGYQVFTAADGEEGIACVKKINPDCILCDVLMPKKTGFEVKDILSRDPETGLIPFIFLTARTELSDIRIGMNLGADDYITKPFSHKDVINAIEIRIKRKNQYLKSIIPHPNETTSAAPKQHGENDRILLDINGKQQLITLKDIFYISAEGDYSYVHISPKVKSLVRKSIKEWTDYLPDNIFFKIHRSTIVNITQIERIEKYFNRTYRIYLKNFSTPLEVSQRISPKLKEKFIV